MDFAMNRPWWATMNEMGGPRGPHTHRGPGPRMGQAPFGPRGFFGPEGPFGPSGPFGPEGPGGRGWGHGRGGRARRGDVRLAILALLAEEPRNGYQVIQAIEERTGGAWKPSPGAVYPALAQLADEGLVEQREDGGRPAYHLTDAGRAAAAEIGQKPWEAEAETGHPWIPEGAPDLWKEFGQLALAARSVLASGDASLAARATQVLQESRRTLYGLLADDPGNRDS